MPLVHDQELRRDHISAAVLVLEASPQESRRFFSKSIWQPMTWRLKVQRALRLVGAAPATQDAQATEPAFVELLYHEQEAYARSPGAAEVRNLAASPAQTLQYGR